MIYRILLALITICSIFSHAATFKECTDLLDANPNLAPYSVGHSQALSDHDLNWLQNLFDKYGSEQNSRETESYNGRTITLKNPFLLYLVIDANGLIEQDPRYHQSNTALKEDELSNLRNILKSMLTQTLDEAQSHPILSLALDSKDRLRISFFGIRYFLKPGYTPALKLHRDLHSSLQSLIEVRRPSHLTGGTTIVAWPQDSLENNRGGFVPEDTVARTWKPQFKTNRLLVFDGRHALHGTRDFFISGRDNQTPAYRDVIGMTIDVVE